MTTISAAVEKVAANSAERLWAQLEAARYLGVSTRYLRASDCPKILLPGTGPKGKRLVRYASADVKTWAERYRALRRFG